MPNSIYIVYQIVIGTRVWFLAQIYARCPLLPYKHDSTRGRTTV